MEVVKASSFALTGGALGSIVAAFAGVEAVGLLTAVCGGMGALLGLGGYTLSRLGR